MADHGNWREANRANWDQRVRLHLAPGGYDLASLRAGTKRMNAIEEAELGPVEGLRVLHLQCHFGNDSLILAQRGALATGVDFSREAIRTARALAAEMRLAPRASSRLWRWPDRPWLPLSFSLWAERGVERA